MAGVILDSRDVFGEEHFGFLLLLLVLYELAYFAFVDCTDVEVGAAVFLQGWFQKRFGLTERSVVGQEGGVRVVVLRDVYKRIV